MARERAARAAKSPRRARTVATPTALFSRTIRPPAARTAARLAVSRAPRS
jgi:hypothetical protein